MILLKAIGMAVLAGGIFILGYELLDRVAVVSWDKSALLESNNQKYGDVPYGSVDETGTITEDKPIPEILVDPEKLDELPQPEVPAQEFKEIKEDVIEKQEETTLLEEVFDDESLPGEINLDIPFFAQAPDGDRSNPWKEACEEASIILAAHYLNGEELTYAIFKDQLLGLVDLQNEIFGDYVDTTIEETARLFREYYGIGQTKIIDNPTIEDIKRELAQGHPVVAPFAGRELGNSHFTNGGPRYHMLVIRGYDDQFFYTNDVGTRYGENFPYTYDVLMAALHDLTEGDITTGKKRILVVTK